MKIYLRNLGFSLVIFGIILGLFDFFLDNYMALVIVGLISIIISRLIKNY
ncbi:MAG: hypothetical protein L7S44_03900 [Flavobacteriaceae bacterium]|nr:hypothetical protein [Flavobacteriaceae bacterium]